MTKWAKVSVGYRHGTGERRCHNCKHMLKDDKCELVQGRIWPQDVCNLWKAKNDKHPVQRS